MLFALGYAVLQQIGLEMRLPPVNVAAFWPATGLAVWVLWRSPRRTWPVYLAALAAVNLVGNMVNGNTVTLSAAFVLVNVAEAALGAALVRRLHRATVGMGSPRWVARVLAPTVLVPTALGGVVAAVLLLLIVGEVDFLTAWRTWFLADALGVLALLPALEALRRLSGRVTVSLVGLAESLAVLLVQGVLFVVVLAPGLIGPGEWAWPFLLLPAVFWSMARLGPGFTAMHTLGVVSGLVWGTALGLGPFAALSSPDARLFSVQAFVAVLLTSSLLTASIIASRERAEEMVRRQSQAMVNAVEGISFVGADGRYHSVNRAYADIHGRAQGELLDGSWLDTVHPCDVPTATAALAAMMREGKATAKVRGLRADEVEFHKEITLVAERDGNGVYQGHHGFARDVTERDAAMAQLDQLFELSPELLAVMDIGRTFRRLNPAWETILGHVPQQLLGRRLEEYVHPDDIQQTLAMLDPSAGRSGRLENRCRRLDGSYLWLAWYYAVDRDRRLVYAVAHDVTSAKETQQALTAARDRALEASRLKSQFLATMSHEIRTPLNGVIGLSDLLGDTELDRTQGRYVKSLRTASGHLLGVINDILDFSKIEAGKFVLDDVSFRLDSLVSDVVSLSEQGIRNKGLTLTHEVDAVLPQTVRGDPMRLRQILTNLVSNAVKFTERGGITVRIEACGAGSAEATAAGTNTVAVSFVVADTGIGMDQATVSRLFAPFQQADTSTTRAYGGTGLGLAICRELVEAMSGSIAVDSEPGSGTTFRVRVPLRPAQAVGERTPRDRERLQILVVDDDETNRLLLQAQITAWGMAVDTADGASPALDLLRRAAAYGDRYDVAVVDMRMPGTSGLELADVIIADPGIPPLPVILLTSAETLTLAQARQSGVGASMTKPVTRSSLYDALVNATTAIVDPGGGEDVRVLLVEDNDINRTVAESILARLGYGVDIANDGVEALAMATGHGYQAILMDCQMPRMDGYTATQMLRQDAATARTPIIAMTANVLKEDRDRCLAAGMDDYLPKPIRAHDMETTLARWIGSLSPRRSPESPPPDEATSPEAIAIRERVHELAGDRTPAEIDFTRRIATAFREQAPGMLARLDAAIEATDWAAVREHTHTLRGTALNLGASALVDTCTAAHAAAATGARDLVQRERQALAAALERTVVEVDRQVAAL